jgi:hypothetical protein
MPKDGLRRLPDHIVPLLLRALMTIPRRPDNRLILQKPDDPRPPVHRLEKGADFNVVWRDRVVGRIWRCDYAGSTGGNYARYHWHWALAQRRGTPRHDGGMRRRSNPRWLTFDACGTAPKPTGGRKRVSCRRAGGAGPAPY